MTKEQIFELAERVEWDFRMKNVGLKLMNGLRLINNRLAICGMPLCEVSLRVLSEDSSFKIAELDEFSLDVVMDFISLDCAAELMDEDTLTALFEMGFYPCPDLETISFCLS